MSLDLFAQIESVAAKVPAGVFTALPAHRWDHVSINGVQSAKVTAHGVTFDPLTRLASVYWTFADIKNPTDVQTVLGTIDSSGHTTVALAPGAMAEGVPIQEVNPRIAARSLFTWQGIKISVELIFDLNGTRQDYRFDGVVWP